MDDIVKDFLIESRENLDRLDQELVRLESDPASKELLASIFRTIHTIKGSCGFLGFARLEKVAHAGESLLSKLRDGVLALNTEMTSGLLAMVDAVRRMLNEIQATEKDGKSDYPELLERLRALQASTAGTASPDAPPPMAAEKYSQVHPEINLSKDGPVVTEVPFAPDPAPASADSTASGQKFRPSGSKIGGLLVERGCIEPEDLALALQEQEQGDHRRLGEILIHLGFCRPEDVEAARQILEARGRDAGVETIRVGVDLLDTLMNLVGELVLARNQLLQASSSAEDAPLQAIAQRMNLIVTEVQQQVMKTRMQPIANIWNKFPRTVRDLAVSCGKEIQLEMEGQDTELDRNIIEAIKDPLTHLLRNAVDHGIETPEVRRQAGKDPTGKLRLRAFQEGGKVNVEITDDGAGLNVDRLRKKAVEKNLLQAEQAASMADHDVFNLIFLPGFSTAEKITNVSGRGVGMDVVKTNIERINGTIELQSIRGKGTTVCVKIPLTLAIVPALIVSCSQERFAIPQASVLELVALDNEKADREIELVHDMPVYRLRGNLLPLVYLDRELQLRPLDFHQTRSLASIVVLQAESRQFGLLVDDILDTEEIVVKPLGEQLKGINAFSGATIMGDGRVALILDVMGLAQRARLLSGARESLEGEQQDPTSIGEAETRQTLLLARNGAEGQVAIPLSTVARLEGFPASLVKRVGDREAMEYRGQVIPLVRLSQFVPPGMDMRDQPAAEGSIEVVIYSEAGRTVGLIVDCIIDIVEEHAAIDPLASRPGVMGSYVSEHTITEVIDVPAILRTAIPNLSGRSETAAAAAG